MAREPEHGGRAAQLLGEPVTNERVLMFETKECSACGNEFELLRYACPRCGNPVTSSPSAEAVEFIQLHQHQASQLVDRGAKLYQRGDLHKAEAEFRRAIEANPWNATAHANIGLIMFRKNRLDEALNWWEKALEIDPRVAGVREMMEQNRVQLARRERPAKAASDTDHGSCAQEVTKAEAAMARHDWEAAIRHYGAAITSTDKDDLALALPLMLAYGVPMLAFLYGERGNAHAHNGDLRSACADYDEALKHAPDNARYLDQRGRAYYGLGRYALAVQDYSRALLHLPSSSDETAATLMRRAASKKELGQRQVALRDLRAAGEMCNNETLRQRIEKLTQEVRELPGS